MFVGSHLRCGPCQHFTPNLAEAYAACNKQKKPFEVVFLSSDRSEADFDAYFKKMPWLALPFEERALKEVGLLSCILHLFAGRK
jgi:nucleoredoxin